MMIIKKLNNPLRPLTPGKHLEIHISTVVLFCIALVLDFAIDLAVTYMIVLLHELAHFCVAKKLGVPGDKLVIMPFGVTMRIKTTAIGSPEDEIKIAVAGPMSNVVMAFCAIALHSADLLDTYWANYLTALNCGIALMNVVPALPLDGGRMLKAYLTLRQGYIKAYNLTMLITRITAVALIILGIVLVFITRFNFSFIMIGAFLVANTVSEQRGKSLILMREILYSRQKLEEIGAENSGVITMMADAPARKALKILAYNKYYTVNIVDNNMEIIGTVTETRLIQKLIDKGIKITASELL